MSNEIATRPNGEVKAHFTNAAEFRTHFQQNRGAMQQVAPPTFDLDKLQQIVFQAVAKNKALSKCTKDSWAYALTQCAETGLVPNGVNNEAYLIPYGNEVQFQVSYKGLIALMKRYGGVVRVETSCVFEGDELAVKAGLHPDLEHTPRFLTSDPAKMTHVYAIVWFKDGGSQFRVLTREDVERSRSKSKQAKAGPWVTDFAAMAMKTAIKQLAKMIDISPKLSLFLQREESQAATYMDAEWSDETDATPAIEEKAA